MRRERACNNTGRVPQIGGLRVKKTVIRVRGGPVNPVENSPDSDAGQDACRAGPVCD